MSASQFEEFDRRMRRINRRHSKLSHGYVTSVNHDGLVVAKPARKGRRGTLRGVAIMVVALMVFKAFLYAQLGPLAYNERVDRLSDGNSAERAGSVVMAADPLTMYIGGALASLVR